MSKRGDFFLRKNGRITDGTLLAVGESRLCTSRIFADNSLFSVTERIDRCLLYGNRSAGFTSLTVGKTGLCTGRSLALNLHVLMTESVGRIGYVTVFTYGASIGCIACIGAGRICGNSVVIVCICAVRNGEVIAGIVSALDGGVVLYLNLLTVRREVQHSNHTL